MNNKIEAFIKKIEELNLFLVRKNDNLLLKGLEGKLTATEIKKIKEDKEIVDFIKVNKQGLLEYIDENYIQPQLYKLSPLQEGILFHGLYERESKAYMVQLTADFPNRLNIEFLKNSWVYVLNHHTILRTAFFYKNLSTPIQRIYEDVALPFVVLDYSMFSVSEQESRLAAFMISDREKGFRFSEAPLMRITVLKMGEESYKMVLSNHHIILDGWSTSIIMKELIKVYKIISKGETPSLKEKDEYEDYIKYIDNENAEEAEGFWKSYIGKLESNSLLPFSGSSLARNKAEGIYKETSLVFDTAFTKELRSYAKKHYLTVNTMFQGIWALLLWKYTGKKDVVYGVTVSGRPTEMENSVERVGLYINTLPLYTEIDGDEVFVEWLTQLQLNHTACREYQYTSLAKIKELSGIKEDLFDSVLIFENYPVSESFSEAAGILGDVSIKEHNNYLLGITIDIRDELVIEFSYNTLLLRDETVTMIRNHFEKVLNILMTSPTSKLSEVNILTANEEHQILDLFNDTKVDYPLDKTFVDLFSDQVICTPDNVAAVFNNKELTYRELDDQSNQLAHYLIKNKIKQDDLVGICLDRSLEMIVGVLGILKSGAAYVPIRPDYPDARIKYIMEEISGRFLITDLVNSNSFSFLDKVSLIVLDAEEPVFFLEPKTPLNISISVSSLAYVIYTSGSTGNPKGAMIEHMGMLNHLLIMVDDFKMDSNSVVAFTAPFTFDISVWQILSALLCGGRIIVYSTELIREVSEFTKSIASNRITILQLVPSYLSNVLELDSEKKLKGLHHFLVTGETISSSLLSRWFINYPNIPVINAYGPTEAADDVSFYIMDKAPEDSSVPIGKPVSNIELYIVDNQGCLCPIGVVGELLVSGVGVGRGYINDKERTDRSFIAHPFKKDTKDKVYKTGDLGRWLPNGTIEFVGRKDDQVKIRGHRIELGEIDNVLLESDIVSNCCIQTREDTGGNYSLIGYVVVQGAFNKEILQEHLKSQLPEYMVPMIWVCLEEMPLTYNGKIDKKALINFDDSQTLTKEYVAPRNEVEKSLVAIWQNLLGVDQVGVYDNFFELGGHSLLATRLVSMIRSTLEAEIEIKDVFTYSVIEDLANYIITQSEKTKFPKIVAQERGRKVPLSFSQERLWFLDQLQQGSIEYNIPASLRLEGILDREALVFGLKKIISRHEILRTVITSEDGIPYQQLMTSDDWSLENTSVESEESLNGLLISFLERPFDLANDYMLRACLYEINKNNHVLAMTFHHISSDAWSDSILVKELTMLYNSFAKNKSLELEPLSLQYFDYAIWQRKYLEGEVLEQQLSYWGNQLQGVHPLLIPTDYVRPPVQSTSGSIISYELDQELSSAIKEVSKEAGVTLFMTLLSAYKVLLYRYSGQEDICVGTSIANRTQKEIEGLIGFFVNTLALRSNLKNEPTFLDFLQQIKEITLDAYDHQLVSFEKVVNRVVTTRDLSMSPLFQVMFELENSHDKRAELVLDDLVVSEYGQKLTTSRFDLTKTAIENESGILLEIEYCTDLFKEETMLSMAKQYETLLRSIVKEPTEKIDRLSIIPVQDKNLILGLTPTLNGKYFNSGVVDLSNNKPINVSFESIVSSNKEAIAVIHGGVQWNYQTLNHFSNKVAHTIMDMGITSGCNVGIYFDRSCEFVGCMLGVFKAGCVYIPLDTQNPPSRIDKMLSGSTFSIVITISSLLLGLEKISGTQIILIDEKTELLSEKYRESNISIRDFKDINSMAIENPENNNKMDSWAYILYTSGSTGEPKGAITKHDGAMNHVLAEYELLGLKDGFRFLQSAGIGSDISVWQILGPLLKGGTCIIVNKYDLLDYEKLIYLLEVSKVNLVEFVPTYMWGLLDHIKQRKDDVKLIDLSCIMLVGESIPIRMVNDIKSIYPHITLWNAYGPCEASDDVVQYEIDTMLSEHQSRVPIGRVIPNMNAIILDKNEELCPIGVIGELCVSGIGVGDGYLGLPTQTAEKFIENPFEQLLGNVLYKTGDLAKWLPNGMLDFIGRSDHQVKIRGHRVELEEIASVHRTSKSVEDCHVITYKDQYDRACVISFVVLNRKESLKASKGEIIDDLKEICSQNLPSYMHPSHYCILEEFPLNLSDKVDIKKLEELFLQEYDADMKLSAKEYVAPRNDAERELVSIWQELLVLEKIGVYDDFFMLGGHSLLATRLVASIRKRMDVEIAIRDIFEFDTLEELANYIRHIKFNKVQVNKEYKTTIKI